MTSGCVVMNLSFMPNTVVRYAKRPTDTPPNQTQEPTANPRPDSDIFLRYAVTASFESHDLFPDRLLFIQSPQCLVAGFDIAKLSRQFRIQE